MNRRAHSHSRSLRVNKASHVAGGVAKQAPADFGAAVATRRPARLGVSARAWSVAAAPSTLRAEGVWKANGQQMFGEPVADAGSVAQHTFRQPQRAHSAPASVIRRFGNQRPVMRGGHFSRLGEAWRGMARPGKAWTEAGPGSARRGRARPGLAWLGPGRGGHAQYFPQLAQAITPTSNSTQD